jgi:hypothetical protein
MPVAILKLTTRYSISHIFKITGTHKTTNSVDAHRIGMAGTGQALIDIYGN